VNAFCQKSLVYAAHVQITNSCWLCANVYRESLIAVAVICPAHHTLLLYSLLNTAAVSQCYPAAEFPTTEFGRTDTDDVLLVDRLAVYSTRYFMLSVFLNLNVDFPVDINWIRDVLLYYYGFVIML